MIIRYNQRIYTVYMTIYAVISIMHIRSFEDKTNYFISVYSILLEYYVCVRVHVCVSVCVCVCVCVLCVLCVCCVCCVCERVQACV